MTDITLKPGKNSTEFIGKVVLQLVIIANLGLKFFKLPALDISPEESIAIAGAIETVWMIFRQWNKRLELSSQTKLMELKSTHEFEIAKLKLTNGKESS